MTLSPETKLLVRLVLHRALLVVLTLAGFFFGYGVGMSQSEDYDTGVKHALSCMLEPEYYEPGQIYVQAMECSRKYRGDWSQ